jgi:(S)-2-hydroxyglutarate dehydrogenase
LKKNYLIVGAGIVGLATAYALVQSSPDAHIIILEKESAIAAHQTSHNSGVIHSGIYYKPGSAKASNCTLGYTLLLDFCDEFKIPYSICGKVIVASHEREVKSLLSIQERGIANGLTGLTLFSSNELKEKEPYAVGVKAIWVPQAGIISYKSVAEKLKILLEHQGVRIITASLVESIKAHTEGWIVKTKSNEWKANYVVTCAGLQSDRLARMTHPSFDVQIMPFRGEYYLLKSQAQHMVKSCIYPVPNPNFPFLGVHFTSTINGGVEAGPNAVWALGRESYRGTRFNLADAWETIQFPGFRKVALKYWKDGLDEIHRSWSKKAFVKSLQKLVPTITVDDLVEGGSGVRAQACDRQGNLMDDFAFLESKDILHVVNAPSPAATSCLSIGRTIANRILKQPG